MSDTLQMGLRTSPLPSWVPANQHQQSPCVPPAGSIISYQHPAPYSSPALPAQSAVVVYFKG